MNHGFTPTTGLYAAALDPTAVSRLAPYFIVDTALKRLVASQPTIVAADHAVRVLNGQEISNGRPPVFAIKTLREIL